MSYVTRLTNVLDEHLGWHRARLKFMARFILSALQLTTSNLRRIAVVLKAEVAEASNYRRIRRFLKDYSVDYTAVSQLLYDRACLMIWSRRIRRMCLCWTERSGILGRRPLMCS